MFGIGNNRTIESLKTTKHNYRREESVLLCCRAVVEPKLQLPPRGLIGNMSSSQFIYYKQIQPRLKLLSAILVISDQGYLNLSFSNLYICVIMFQLFPSVLSTSDETGVSSARNNVVK